MFTENGDNQESLYMVNNTQVSQGRHGRMTVTGDGNTVTQNGHGEITVNGVYCDIIQRSSGYIAVNGNHCRISQHQSGELIIHGNDHEIRQYGPSYVRIIGTGNRVHVYGNGEVSLRGRARNNFVVIHSGNATVRNHGRYNTIENVYRQRERRRQDYQQHHYDHLLAQFLDDDPRLSQERGRREIQLKKEAIQRLPVSEISAVDVQKEEEECSICIEPFEAKDKVMTLPCIHRYGTVVWCDV